MVNTRAATVDFRDGLLIVRIREGVRQTLDDARANIDAAAQASAGARPGLLLDITKAVPLEPAVRHFYAGPVVVGVCSALALLVETSPLGRIFGNVYLRVANPGVPTRVFDRETKALAWLLRQRAPAAARRERAGAR
jgi:hypothetical protein